MCGIFGVLLRPAEGKGFSYSTTVRVLRKLYRYSESRGQESAGLHIYLPSQRVASTLKVAGSADTLLESTAFDQLTSEILQSEIGDDRGGARTPIVMLAHSRLVTNGTAQLPENNQPVRWGSVTMVHNGIICNVDDLWGKHARLKRNAEVDTEVMAALAHDEMAKSGSTTASTQRIFGEIRGAASIAWVHDATTRVSLATNTGDLYYAEFPGKGALVFASEQYILRKAIEGLADEPEGIKWVPPGTGICFDLCETTPAESFLLSGYNGAQPGPTALGQPVRHRDLAMGGREAPTVIVSHADESLLRYSEARVRTLRRCSKCVLPETFPLIDFDERGVCNICRNYRPRYAGMDATESKGAFIRKLEKYRGVEGKPDAIVAFSGGRDSSYGLHLIKKEFGLTPITFTYDWGMVTDLARRNIARICGALGIQNILVSANLQRKRDNIRKNVSAWLRQPDLGLVPLFMAGDKHFFRIVNDVKKQTGIPLDLWCANPLENTDFKAGFCGIAPDHGKVTVDYLSFGRKMQLAWYYGTRFLRNPTYLNSSVGDTLGAFMAYYFAPRRDFYFIFDHFVWNEDEVNATLLSQYDWELSPDSPSTWRIGDGTAPFYNYIYTTARGFSEFDTFRSNQIREGMISRERALEAVVVENRPRAQSLRWYLDAIGLDFDEVIRTINGLDTLKLHH